MSYDNFHVHLRPHLGTPYADTKAKIQEFLGALKKAETEINAAQPPGSPSMIEGLDVKLEEVDPIIWVEFSSDARKHFHVRELIDRWYKHIPDMGDFQPDFHTPTEQDVVDLEIEVQSPNPQELAAVMTILKDKLADYPDITEIEDSRRPGKPELRFDLTAEAIRLGISVNSLAEQVRAAYAGEIVQRFIRGRDEVKTVVRLPRSEREGLPDLTPCPFGCPTVTKPACTPWPAYRMHLVLATWNGKNDMGKAGLHVKLAQDSKLNGKDVFANLEERKSFRNCWRSIQMWILAPGKPRKKPNC